MTGNEDKLRRVLFEEAQTVLPSSDAWPKIREGVARKRRWRQWLQYGGATAGATAAIVVGVVLATGGEQEGPDPSATDGQTPTASASADPTPSAEPTPTPSPTDEPTPTPTTTPSATPTATPSGAPAPSATSTPARPSATPTPGPVTGDVPAGVLGDNFVSAVRDSGGFRLALLSKRNGSVVRYLTDPSATGADPQVQATPDGKFVYFVRPGGACESAIARVAVSGGKVETIVDKIETVTHFALNGDATRIAGVRTAECGGSEESPILVEYDAKTGDEIGQLHLDNVAKTVVTGIAWHPLLDELAVSRTSQDGKPDSVDLFEKSDSGRSTPVKAVTGLEPCLGSIKSLVFSATHLYIARDCMNPEDASKSGHVYRVGPLGESTRAELVAESPAGMGIGGLHAEREDGGVVYTTARWAEEDTEGPSTAYRLGAEGKPASLFTSESPLFDLAW